VARHGAVDERECAAVNPAAVARRVSIDGAVDECPSAEDPSATVVRRVSADRAVRDHQSKAANDSATRCNACCSFGRVVDDAAVDEYESSATVNTAAIRRAAR